MRKFAVALLVIIMIVNSALIGCSPSSEDMEGSVGAPEEFDSEVIPLISFDYETSEETTNLLIETMDPYMIDISSPFYIPETFTFYLNDADLFYDRDELVNSIVMSAMKASDLAFELSIEMDSYQNDLFGLFDSYIAIEEELPYVYTASNRYAEMFYDESVLEANLDFAEFDGYMDYLNDARIFSFVIDAEYYALSIMDRLDWITIDGANLYMASELIGDDELSMASEAFKESMMEHEEKLDEMTGELAQSIMVIHQGLEDLEISDQYVTLASMKFIQSQLPELREIQAGLEPSDHINEEDIEIIRLYLDALEVYSIGTEMLYLEDNQYDLALEPWEWERYVERPDMKWFDIMPISYAAASSQAVAEMTAYQQKAKQVLNKVPPEVKPKAGYLSSIWSGIEKAGTWVADKARNTRQKMGYALDFAVATRKSVVDYGMMKYYNVPQTDIDKTLYQNYMKIEENYKKGISGSAVLDDATQFIQNIEDLPGEVLYATIGENAVTKTLDNTSKFVTGTFTGFAKGLFTLGNAKSTNAELANAAFDVTASFVSFTKVAEKLGKPFVKYTAGIMGSAGQTAKGVITELAEKGSKYVGDILAKAPPLLGTEVKKNLGKMVNVYSQYWYDKAANLTANVGAYIAGKTAPLTSGVKTLTTKAGNMLKNSSIVQAIVSKSKDFGADMKKALVQQLGNSFESFIKEYAATEGFNTIKEINLTLESVVQQYFDEKASEEMDALKKAKAEGKLPKPSDVKFVSNKKAETAGLPTTGTDITPSNDPRTSGDGGSNSKTELQETAQTQTKTELPKKQEETKPETKLESETEPKTEPKTETEPEEEEDDGPVFSTFDPAQFEGSYSGSASDIVFYETDSGQLSFPLGQDHSSVSMAVLNDGKVIFDISVYGTQMFDFSATIKSSVPATYDGSIFTCTFSDFQGAATTVSGYISHTYYEGTIGIYDEKNARIGHISFSMSGN